MVSVTKVFVCGTLSRRKICPPCNRKGIISAATRQSGGILPSLQQIFLLKLRARSRRPYLFLGPGGGIDHLCLRRENQRVNSDSSTTQIDNVSISTAALDRPRAPQKRAIRQRNPGTNALAGSKVPISHTRTYLGYLLTALGFHVDTGPSGFFFFQRQLQLAAVTSDPRTAQKRKQTHNKRGTPRSFVPPIPPGSIATTDFGGLRRRTKDETLRAPLKAFHGVCRNVFCALVSSKFPRIQSSYSAVLLYLFISSSTCREYSK